MKWKMSERFDDTFGFWLDGIGNWNLTVNIYASYKKEKITEIALSGLLFR